jgi:hypothetical protein
MMGKLNCASPGVREWRGTTGTACIVLVCDHVPYATPVSPESQIES